MRPYLALGRPGPRTGGLQRSPLRFADCLRQACSRTTGLHSQMRSWSTGVYERSTSCRAVAKYPPGGIVTSEDEAEENKAVFLDDGELEDNAQEIAIDLARLAWETKVEDISVVDVAAQTSVCSYMVIATVFSRPQLNAVLGKMEKAVTETWQREYTLTEGRSAWEALDMGDVLVHIMSEEARHYYNLEGLYGGGTPVELPFMSDEDRAKRDVWSTTL